MSSEPTILPNISIVINHIGIKLLNSGVFHTPLKDIKKSQAIIVLAGLILFVLAIDSQCYFSNEACLPDLGYYISAPNIVSDQDLLLKGLQNGTINKEWKEKPGEVYGVIASKIETGNYHTFSIASSIALLVITYFLCLKITSNRIASIIAVLTVSMSRTFLWYSDSIPYPDFWCTLFFLSLYPFKNKFVKPICYLGSFVMKAQALAFLPITIMKEQNKKIKIFYIIIGVLATGIAVSLNWVRSTGFNTGNFLPPWVVFEIILQDWWMIALFFPVGILLFLLHRKKVEWSGTILTGMLWSLFFQYILALFTSYGAFSERMITFVVFFGLGAGLIISKHEMLLERWKKSASIKQ